MTGQKVSTTRRKKSEMMMVNYLLLSVAASVGAITECPTDYQPNGPSTVSCSMCADGVANVRVCQKRIADDYECTLGQPPLRCLDVKAYFEATAASSDPDEVTEALQIESMRKAYEEWMRTRVPGGKSKQEELAESRTGFLTAHFKKKPALTRAPTRRPTRAPTRRRTRAPTRRPTRAPTRRPTIAPTRRRTRAPTRRPTRAPTRRPTRAPTRRAPYNQWDQGAEYATLPGMHIDPVCTAAENKGQGLSFLQDSAADCLQNLKLRPPDGSPDQNYAVWNEAARQCTLCALTNDRANYKQQNGVTSFQRKPKPQPMSIEDCPVENLRQRFVGVKECSRLRKNVDPECPILIKLNQMGNSGAEQRVEPRVFVWNALGSGWNQRIFTSPDHQDLAAKHDNFPDLSMSFGKRDKEPFLTHSGSAVGFAFVFSPPEGVRIRVERGGFNGGVWAPECYTAKGARIEKLQQYKDEYKKKYGKYPQVVNIGVTIYAVIKVTAATSKNQCHRVAGWGKVTGGVTLKERMHEVAQKIKNTQGSTRLGSDNKATTHETVQTRGTQSCAMPKEWETPSGHANILVRTEKKCPRPLGQGQSIGQSVGLAAAAHSKTPFTGIFCGLNEGVTRKLHEATDEAIREQVAQFRFDVAKKLSKFSFFKR